MPGMTSSQPPFGQGPVDGSAPPRLPSLSSLQPQTGGPGTPLPDVPGGGIPMVLIAVAVIGVLVVAVGGFLIGGGLGIFTAKGSPSPSLATSSPTASSSQSVPPSSAPPSESSSPERPIAFYRVADGKPQIWLVEPGSDPVQLTSGNSISSGPAWSPDGSVIAIANREPGKPAELAVVTIVDKKISQLTTAAEVTGRPTWSTFGKQITIV